MVLPNQLLKDLCETTNNTLDTRVALINVRRRLTAYFTHVRAADTSSSRVQGECQILARLCNVLIDPKQRVRERSRKRERERLLWLMYKEKFKVVQHPAVSHNRSNPVDCLESRRLHVTFGLNATMSHLRRTTPGRSVRANIE